MWHFACLYSYSCFSFHICFLDIIVLLVFMLPVLFLVSVIIPSLHFICCLRFIVLMNPCYLQCWRVFLLLLFLTLITCLCHLLGVRPYASSLAFLSSGLFVEVLPSSISRMFSVYLTRGTLRCLSVWWDSCNRTWFWEVFSFVWDILFLFFFSHLHLFDGVRFQYSHVLVSFLFSERSDFFLIWLFFSFCYLTFSAFHY